MPLEHFAFRRSSQVSLSALRYRTGKRIAIDCDVQVKSQVQLVVSLHARLHGDFRGIVARGLAGIIVAPLDRPALRRLERVCVGGVVAEVT